MTLKKLQFYYGISQRSNSIRKCPEYEHKLHIRLLPQRTVFRSNGFNSGFLLRVYKMASASSIRIGLKLAILGILNNNDISKTTIV